MRGFVVRRRSSTTSPVRSWRTPAASRPNPSTSGTRPTARRMTSPPARSSPRPRSNTITFPSGPASTRTRRAPRLSAICSRSKRAVRIAAASGSSRGRRRGSRLTIATSLPSRRKACASSQPIGPAPTTSRRRGRSVKEKIVSLVRKPASARPGTGSVAAREPVATTARLKRSCWPPTSTVSGPTKRASPK